MSYLARSAHLAILITFATWLTPSSTSAQQDREPEPTWTAPRPGTLTPRSAHTWLQIRDLPALVERLGSHPLADVLQELRATDNPIAKDLEAVQAEFLARTAAMNLQPGQLLSTLGKDLRLSLFENEDGKNDFLLTVELGTQSLSIERELDKLGTRKFGLQAAPKANPGFQAYWQLPHPTVEDSKLYARLSGARLLLSGSKDSLTMADELARGDRTPLSDDPLFGRLIETAEDTPWLSVFTRPSALAKALGGSAADLAGSTWRDLGIHETPALALQSTFVGGRFHDMLRLSLPEGGETPLGFVRATPRRIPAALVPPDCSEWLALRFSAKGLPATARHARELAPWLESLSTLPSRLAEQNVSMDDLLAFLGTETVVLGGHGNADSRCLCFAPTDRSGLEAVLRKMSDTGKEPVPPAEDKTEDVKTGESKTEKGAVEDGQADQVLDELLETVADDARYVVDLRGGKIHVALKDSLLLVTPRAQDLDRILRQLDSGMADPAVEKAFDQPAAWLLGKLDTSAWLRARDKGGKRGLEAPARHLRPIEYRGSHASGILEVTAEGETGTAHLLAGALERTLPAIRNTFERIELATIVKRAKTLAEAQKTYMKLVMRDSDKDGIGEAGEAGNLLSEGLLADSEAFQQLSAEVLAGKTYSYRILIPGAVDGAESHYFVLAWPTDSEGPSILLSDSGEVRVNRSVASLDADYGPNLFQLFEGEPFRSSLRSEWIVSGMAASKESTPEAPAVATPSPVSETPVKPEKPSLDESIAILDAARQSKDMDTIRPYLENENTILQARATHYIGDLKDRKSVPLLVRLLKESVDPEVRRRAIRALALIRDPRGQSSLIEALSDSDATVRLFAATGLIGSKDPAAKEGLLGLIATHTDDSKGDRTQAVLALHDMKDPTCLRSLFTVDEGTPHFQQALVYAFQNLSPELEPEEETKLLIAALGCPNRALRAYAIQRLSESKRTEAVSALNDRLAEEGDELRPMLTRAIESLAPPSSFNFAELWEDAQENGKQAYRNFVAWFKKQDAPVKYAVSLAPVGFFVIFLLVWRLRRRRQRQRAHAQMQEWLRPSEDFGSGEHRYGEGEEEEQEVMAGHNRF